MNRLEYVLRRLVLMVPVVIGVTVVVFFLVRLIPGDPARTLLGTKATSRRVAELHQEWGLDKPLPVQYGYFMGRLVHGSFGNSLFYRVPVSQLIYHRVGATLLLLAYAVILLILITVPLATLAATKKDGLRDHMVRAVPVIGLGMPPFWLGITLIFGLALRARLFPVGGYGDTLSEHLYSMFLPALTVALAIAPILIRSLRARMLEVLDSDYIAAARSKGASERRVFSRHVLRNAASSTVVVFGVNIAWLVGGTLVVEKVFAIPGIGALMIDAIFNRDFPIVQGVTFVFAILVVLVYLVTDVVHFLLDPRVRFD